MFVCLCLFSATRSLARGRWCLWTMWTCQRARRMAPSRPWSSWGSGWTTGTGTSWRTVPWSTWWTSRSCAPWARPVSQKNCSLLLTQTHITLFGVDTDSGKSINLSFLDMYEDNFSFLLVIISVLIRFICNEQKLCSVLINPSKWTRSLSFYLSLYYVYSSSAQTSSHIWRFVLRWWKEPSDPSIPSAL